MATIAFDSLSASKRLREAGMDERMAETVVEIFQQAAGMPDISHLATKDDLKPFATKDDLKQSELAMKADILETKFTLRTEMAQMEVRLSEKIRMQGWSLLGGMAVLLAFYTALAKLIA
jgi:hypothetical protein